MGIAARRIKSELSSPPRNASSIVDPKTSLAAPSIETGLEKRICPRYPANDLSEIILPGKKFGTACLIHDISNTGAKLETSLGELPKRFVLVNYTRKTKTLCSLIWHRGRFLGVNFLSEPRSFIIE